MSKFEDIGLDRGNFWVANLDKKPRDWTKDQYASFCQMRSYPKQQLEKLLYDLKDKKMRLSDESFHFLIREVLYHIGPLTNEENSEKK